MATQTQSGKAFEYALITEAETVLSAIVQVNLIQDSAYHNAKNCYSLFNVTNQHRYLVAANAAIKHLLQLEPRLTAPTGPNDVVQLQLMPDSAGTAGDVRDVLFSRPLHNWQIGISAKNNHKAVKHSRLSDNIDFGWSWVGINCSTDYFSAIAPIFTELRTLRAQATKWRQLTTKHASYYKPVLDAFKNELLNLNNNNSSLVPPRLVGYLIGNNDFYKVIKRPRAVEMLGFNINGTLNKNAGSVRPAIRVPQLRLPQTIVQLDYKTGSRDTLELICDQGWQISFRIHNAETLVVPSLKFDINLIGHPQTIYSNHIITS